MKFIHFGCWNNGGCGAEKTNGLSLMTKKLNSYIDANSIDFITVAGDNYYPPKSDLGKKFIEDDFFSGFSCLPKIKTKYLLFGNHDIEDVVIDSDGRAIKCKLLDEQIKIAEANNTIKIFNDVLFKVIGSTLIIMFDSNLYDREVIDTPISDTCYAQLFNNLVNKSGLTLGNLIQYQNEDIERILDAVSGATNVIFIAHHPIYSIKNKKGGKNVFALNLFVDFLKTIDEKLLGKKVYYLCADTHLYQEGVVNISPKLNIRQYVVGTGGADQDEIFSSDNTIVKNGITVYTKGIEKKEWGFLEVDISGEHVNFKFISANPGLVGGSNIKKYRITNRKL
jgi:hypothetical protein